MREGESLSSGLGLWLKQVPPHPTHSSFPKRTTWVVSHFTVPAQGPILVLRGPAEGKAEGGLPGAGCCISGK